jgi:beta-xylosidase
MKPYKTILKIIFCISIIAYDIAAQGKITSGNPILDGWYADPEAVIFEGKYWIFPTYSAKYEDQVFVDAFSSTNLVDWTKHHAIIDTTKIKWAEKAMWAPSIIKKGGNYFLFFSANDIQSLARKGLDVAANKEDENGGIGIAIASTPQGPYRDYLGKPLINKFYNKAQPIDQYVFKNTDGQYYIIYGGWGHCNLAKLNEDFTALVPFENGELAKEITPEGYVEGPTLFIRKGKYYLMWSEGNWTDETYKVAYATSQAIDGAFEKQGTILKTDPNVATGAGHHSVINIPNTDDWYIIYHRRPIPNKGRDHRVVCIEKMYFKSDGSIKPIRITFEGTLERLLR